MVLTVTGRVWYWRGPAPFFFVTVPEPLAAQLKKLEKAVSYGWGMIPVDATIGETTFYTALWPKDGLYILPLKAEIRKRECIEEGDDLTALLEVRSGR